MNFKLFILKILALIIFINCAEHAIGQTENDTPYIESVYMHVGREVYIAGEIIWYSAYCLPEGFNEVISKPLYTEMVNAEGVHILGQITEIKDQIASSSIYIPDTISSGLYFIKSYTNWMRNFSEKKFFLKPIYIYNQYDNNYDQASGNLLGTHLFRNQEDPALIEEDIIRLTLASKEFTVNQMVNVTLKTDENFNGEFCKLSVSIHKKINSTKDTIPDKNISDIKTVYKDHKPIKNKQVFVAEDLGILMTGTVLDIVNEQPADGLEVILSIIDTIPVLYSSTSDIDGRFSFLIKNNRQQEAYISLFSGGEFAEGKYEIIIDPKFHNSEANMTDDIMQTSSPEKNKFLQEEAERVMIQKAFGNQNMEFYDSVLNSAAKPKVFYGEPLQVIYPDDYYMLPNFEEICRELSNRVKYKKTKNSCKISIFQVEENNFSTNPLVLFDGHPVKDLCVLYPLNSEDINKIEVQSALRVSGNLLYNGLVAVYTTDQYKRKNDSFRKKEQKFWVPGYTVSPTFSELYGSGNITSSGMSTLPDFKNQLFWQSGTTLNKTEEIKLAFTTTDEEGDYIIEIHGITSEGNLFEKYELINVRR